MSPLQTKNRAHLESFHPKMGTRLTVVDALQWNGFEVLEWVRQQPALKQLVIVVLTSSNLAADINRAYDLGTNSYLVKAGDFDGLIKLVKALAEYWLARNRKPKPGTAPDAATLPLPCELGANWPWTTS